MRYFVGIFIFLVVAVVSILGFRGQKSVKPPIYVFPDMDYQAKFKPQAENEFFADGRNDRPVPPGTAFRGYAFDMKEVFDESYADEVIANPAKFSARGEDGEWYRGFPIEITHEAMSNGKERYQIFCAVCHGESGNGRGVLANHGSDYELSAGYFAAITSLLDPRIVDMPEGQIFNTITHGLNTMMPYGHKLNPEERWQVILYVRALQLASNATVADVPADQKGELGL